MRERFPGVIFHTAYFGEHDHPRAHAECMLGTRRLTSQIQAGHKILDIFGNPGANEGFNKDQSKKLVRPKSIDTLVCKLTASDYFRAATKWGAPYDDDGAPRYIEQQTPEEYLDPDFLAQYDGAMSVHVDYYLTHEQRLKLLRGLGEGKIYSAQQHKFKMGETLMFDGEISVLNDGESLIQTNRETGRAYPSPSNDWIWTSASKVYRAVVDGEPLAYQWDLEKFTADTWIIKYNLVPYDLDSTIKTRIARASNLPSGPTEESVVQATRQVFAKSNAEDQEGPLHTYKKTISVKCGSVTRVGSLMNIVTPTGTKAFNITNEPFFEYLKSQSVGRPKTDETLRQLFTIARRDIASSTFPGTTKFQVVADEVEDHVFAAFISGLNDSISNMSVIALLSKDLKLHASLSATATTTQHATDARSALRLGVSVASTVARISGRSALSGELANFT